jgi:HD-GYP domain-containing protein (c-di-GMP phosphodiesterase class II)
MTVTALPAPHRPALVEELELTAHGRSVSLLAMQLADALGFESHRLRRVGLAGALHDVGKGGIDPRILAKPGPLDPDEWEQIRLHPELGERILRRAGLIDAARWVRYHHERPDGQGYPDGLRDEEIPVEAAILAVADAFDAMITDRCYGEQLDHDQALDELCRCAGTQFDPTVVVAAVRCDLHVSDGADAPTVNPVG